MKFEFILRIVIEMVSANHVTLLISYSSSTAASNSVCLNKFHVATCAVLNLVCLHRAALSGNTPC